MARAAIGFAKEQFFAPNLTFTGFGSIQPPINVEFWRGREIQEFLKLCHVVNLRASVQNAQSFLGSSHRIAVEVRRALLELSEVFDSLQCSL